MLENLAVNHDLLRGFAFYSVIVLFKMLLMAPFTGFQRLKNNAFANPEDARPKRTVPNLNHPDVERVRRNHLNDLENIPIFIFLGLFYVLSNPNVEVAMWHFRLFAASRILHTISYSILHNGPLRGLAWSCGLFVCVSMFVQCVTHFKRW